MKILAIDTASDVCGVSILEDETLICNLDVNTGRTHSENLMLLIKNALEKSNLLLSDIDLIVCDKGPGSFTGIRIGIATVKAFCDSLSIKCIGISSLEALAYNVKQDGYICSLIDCKNDNYYYALYKLENGSYTEVLEPNTNNINMIFDLLNTYNDNVIFVGDLNMEYFSSNKILSNYTLSDNNILNSYSLGIAGFRKYKYISESSDININCDTNFDILPLYLKKPQAQKQLEKKLSLDQNSSKED